ncbi:MAG: sensor histidine kinase [Solirubrobacterales bacterium]|nr:sensor histidine kinase [Solirubrobacterales bacterium]
MHEALFYDGDRDYLDGLLRFITPALSAGQPVAAAVPPQRAELLRQALDSQAGQIEILDMYEVGRNPARIIPAMERLLVQHGGSTLHYVGEPVWPGRSPEEIREAAKHEALINLAWPGTPIRVLCPYDAVGLDPRVLADAERTHPTVIRGGRRQPSSAYDGGALRLGAENVLPPAPPEAIERPFGLEELQAVRGLVTDEAGAAGLRRDRIQDLVLAISELATNTIRHGRGSGILRVWRRPDRIICQVEDGGHIRDPLAGRRAPAPDAAGGIGLWAVNQLCDLVEVHSSPRGTTVRVHTRLP